MKVSEWRRIDKGDLQSQIPKWMEVFLDAYNRQMENVSQALSGRITFRDNMLQDTLRLSVGHGFWYSFKLDKLRRQKTPAIGALVLNSDLTVTGFQWARVDQETVKVRFLFDGAPSGSMEVEVAFFG